MRPLTLHVSALSDAEYDLYTASLNDLATDTANANTTSSSAIHVRDDTHYEQTSVGVREVRAWLRGRYSDLPASDIDTILKFFYPNMLPSDVLTSGQFFAALRLVLHAKSGKGIDRALAFIQPSLEPSKVPRSLSPKRPVQAPPSHPDRQRPHPLITSSPETNPFTRRSLERTTAPLPPVDPEPVPAVPPQRFSRKVSQNPFLVRDKPDAGPDKPNTPVNVPDHGKIPPLPPRKPALFSAPPRRAPEATPTSAASTFSPFLVPTKSTHVMSPLMRQSLEASKHAQTMKRVEEQLDRERVLQVLKTTSSSSSISDSSPNMRTRSLSPSKQLQKPSPSDVPGSGSAVSDDATCVPPLPRRRKPSLPSSTSSSVLSLEQVAGATLVSPALASSRPPPLPSRDMPWTADRPGLPAVPGPGPIPPPMHPYRRPSTSTEPNVNDSHSSSSSSVSVSSRVVRSKSVTASSSGPPPPPRRRRPESMQLTPTSDMSGLPALPPFPAAHARTASFQGLSRHSSLSRDRERDPSDSSPMTHLQKTLTNLQLKAQPKLDAVRYKAEAGLSRRGYIHHAQLGGYRWRDEGEQGLMADTRWPAANVDRNSDSEPTTEDEPSPGGVRGAPRTMTSTARHRDFLTESDNLKWPAGEGWKPL